jgi:formylglycine-generating enzyme required for sulfatase activity
MEMSGNVREYAVTVANDVGRGFEGSPGDGSLDSSGNADVSDWPGADASGAYFRGGGWKDNIGNLRVMNRKYITGSPDTRDSDTGFRCVRTAP